MVLTVRSFLDRNPWMSTSCVRSVTRRRCRSGSFLVCMHPVGRYYRVTNVNLCKGVGLYSLGNWMSRENQEIILGHSNFFPRVEKNLLRPSSLPLCDDSVFEMSRGTNRTKLTPMFLDHEVTLYSRGGSGTCMELRLTGKVFPLRKSPSHARSIPVQLFSHCFLGFNWLQILHLSSPHEPQGMLLLQNRR